MDDFEDSPAPSPNKLSKTPSWVMLGFVLGALFVWALPRPTPPAAAPADKPQIAAAARTPAQVRLTTIEALFAEWGRYAVWENELTEVAMWNPEVNRFADIFEVFRANGVFYFRSIPRFTRPLLTHGVPNDSLLQFTESAASRQRWLHEVSEENSRAFNESVRETFSGKRRTDVPDATTPVTQPPPPERP